jgi:RimJ/RimL family protein N-acetyltransferase
MADPFDAHVFEPLTLETDRLRLRPFREDDIPATQRACADELTQEWLALPRPYTLEDARTFCLTTTEEERISGGGVHCAVTLKQTDELVGCIGLRRTMWITRCTEIGYWSVPEHRGRGTEATRALAGWAFDLGMERVELLIAPGNVASETVAKNARFTLEGTLRNRGFINTGRVDLTVWSRIPTDR